MLVHPEIAQRADASMKTERPCDYDPEAYAILQSFDLSQFVFAGEKPDLPRPVALDLFSGRAGVAKQLIKLGAPWVLTFEWKRSASENLLQPELREKIEKMLRGGAFRAMGAAPICSSFSIAVTPPVRSSKFPRGIPGMRKGMRKKVSEGNSHNDWLADRVALCEELQLLWWVENPDTSWWWRQRRWRRFRDSRGRKLFRLCFCRFGCKWKKPTRIATNTSLAGVRMWCTCTQKHLQLRGTCRAKGVPWTQVAEPYPRGLCRMLAAAVSTGVGWALKRGLNVAECAKTGTLRVGEAKNPGPRPAKSRHAFSLEEVNTVSAATLAIESRVLQQFFGALPQLEMQTSRMFSQKSRQHCHIVCGAMGTCFFNVVGHCLTSGTCCLQRSAGARVPSLSCRSPGRLWIVGRCKALLFTGLLFLKFLSRQCAA